MTRFCWIAALSGAIGVCSAALCQEADQEPKREPELAELLPRSEPLPPTDALDSFQIESGFRVELVAAEPQVADPIAITFDEDGRIYVAEMVDYPDKPSPEHPPQGRIRLLEDPDGDGLYDKSTVFAERLTWPGGVTPWNGGVYVCATPDILYLKDTDGDGVADSRRVAYTGFQLGKAEDIANGLMRGFDGKIYGVTSFNGGDIVTVGQESAAPVSVRGRDFRFDPQTERFEAISSANGDFGNTFDDWGNRFVCNSGTLLKHVVLTGDYLSRNPYLAVPRVQHDVSAGQDRVFGVSPPEPWRVVRRQLWDRWVNTSHDMRAARFPPRELTPTGFVTGAAGVTIYRGEAFPPEFQGNAFIGEAAGNAVIRLSLQPDGVTFACQRPDADREFLASTDNWFRPVNFANGPDGCLYVVDMYRETIEDPSAIPQDILNLLDMSSGSDRGRIYRIVPENYERQPPVRLGRMTTVELVNELASPNGWRRETAQRLLAERQDSTAVESLRQLVRAAAHAPARLHGLWTLAEMGAIDEGTLSIALKDQAAPVREHASRLAEGVLNPSATLRAAALSLADDAAPRVRFQAAFSIGEMTGDDALAALARIARRDAADPWIRSAILTSDADRAAPLAESLLADPAFLNQAGAADLVAGLAAVIGGQAQPDEIRAVLDAVFSLEHDAADQIQRQTATSLGGGLLLSGSSLGDFLERVKPKPRTVAKLRRMFAAATEGASDERLSVDSRVESIRLLGHADFETAAPVLAELLSPQQAHEIQLAAVQTLGAYARAEVGPLLVERWTSYSPALRREVAESLFSRPDRLPALLSALENREVAEGDLDPARIQSLLKHPDKRLRRRARQALAAAPRSDRKKLVESYRSAPALAADAQRGAKIYKTHCATCHPLRGVGRTVGPDLATVLNRSDEELLIAILDPNREVKPNYVNYSLVTSAGKIVTGIIAQETASSITLTRAEGAQDTILRNQVEQLVSSGLSLMPEGLEKPIGPQQMADLLRFLRSAPSASPP